jgi:hypothetical protein
MIKVQKLLKKDKRKVDTAHIFLVLSASFIVIKVFLVLDEAV